VKQQSTLIPKTENQKDYLDSLNEADQIFAVGGAGTGKTYVAGRFAIRKVLDNAFYRVIVARPTVSQLHHKLGFLPGDANDKLEPWMRPIWDAFAAEAQVSTIDQLKHQGRIEIVAFEHIRGRTFDDAIVILDEAQNCTLLDLRTFLTRIGENSKLIVCGDMDQCDIDNPGLTTVIDMIEKYDIDADIIEFTSEDVVRSKTAKEWVKAFERNCSS
jgi:phosphate starvation-inducible PhoH-like protein